MDTHSRKKSLQVASFWIALGSISFLTLLMVQYSSLSCQMKVLMGVKTTLCNQVSYRLPTQDHQLFATRLGSAEYQFEVVNTEASITQGLSGRTAIGSDGMLFVLPKADKPAFWMKEMQFGLDLVWIRKGTIIAITQQVPKPLPNQNLNTLPLYYPPQPVDMILEVPAGFAQEESWQIGQTLTILE